jgi:hypothetical protein
MKTNWLTVAIFAGTIAATFGVVMFLNSVVIVYVIYVLGGAFLAVLPFSRGRLRSGWARVLISITAVLLLCIGAVDLLRYSAVWIPSLTVQHAVLNLEADVRGVVLGFLLALLISGELAGRKNSTVGPA